MHCDLYVAKISFCWPAKYLVAKKIIQSTTYVNVSCKRGDRVLIPESRMKINEKLKINPNGSKLRCNGKRKDSISD